MSSSRLVIDRLFVLSALLVSLAAAAPAQPPPAATAVAPPRRAAAARHKTITLHGSVRAASDAALTLTVPGQPDQTVILSKRGHALRKGQPSTLGSFQPGESVSARGYLTAPGALTATSVMDAESALEQAASRRAPIVKVTAFDDAHGAVTLKSDTGSIHLVVQRSRIRIGRRTLGSTNGLAVGQRYAIRLGSAADGQPIVTLTNPIPAKPKTRRRPRAR